MHIAFLSTYPPRVCGLATFTQDLVNQAGNVGINSIGVTGPEALRIGSGPWTPTTSSAYAVFRITGDQAAQVPEPSTLCLLGFGGIALALCTRRHS